MPSDPDATTMIFPPEEKRRFLTKWENDQRDCKRALDDEAVVDHPRWTPDYNLGPFATEKDREAFMNQFRRHPFYDKVEFRNDGSFKPPPKYTALSDELVFMVAKTVSLHDRGRKWPTDFTRGGDIRLQRTPKDLAPRIDVHGLPTAPIFKGYYVLLGQAAVAATGGWKLASKTNKRLRRGSNQSDWTVGSVVLAADFATLPRSITYRVHDLAGSIIDLTALRQGSIYTRDTVATPDSHHCMLVTKDGLEWPLLYQVNGYHVRCSSHSQASITPRNCFTDTLFDYDAVKRSAYAVNLNPTWDRSLQAAPAHRAIRQATASSVNQSDEGGSSSDFPGDDDAEQPQPHIQNRKRTLAMDAATEARSTSKKRTLIITNKNGTPPIDSTTETLCRVFKRHFGRTVEDIKTLSALRDTIDEADSTLDSPLAKRIIRFHEAIGGMRSQFHSDAANIKRDIMANIPEDELRPRALQLLYSVAPDAEQEDTEQEDPLIQELLELGPDSTPNNESTEHAGQASQEDPPSLIQELPESGHELATIPKLQLLSRGFTAVNAPSSESTTIPGLELLGRTHHNEDEA
ncbi:hypothetical protein PENDEC_c001G06145 [Penicillium decumbens]|uniref:Uncharacterized protein n=1 Tax=Penicillium decumbens TaxID=69771 RepID=A0A1V6PNK9_PENDC|nr:hypothetical protein PENDEC_c001G06145 [Penicillium decumbens]